MAARDAPGLIRPRILATIQWCPPVWRTTDVLDKNKIDKEFARRLSAAFISNQMGVSITTQYKKTPEDVGDLWYFLAALADKLARESQEGVYRDWGRLATEIIH
jgi:hypothetical protein